MEISVKDIVKIYQNAEMADIIEVFTQKIRSIDEDIATLTELRSIVEEFRDELLKNGISNINAFPALLDITGERRPVPIYNDNMDRLDIISQKRAGELNIRYVDMRPMRVLSSHYRGTNRAKQGDEQEYGAEYRRITGGDHKIYSCEGFEGHSLTRRIPDDCVNDTPFEDYVLEGLFIAATTPSALDVGDLWGAMNNWLHDNEFIEIDDYTAGGSRDAIYGTGSTTGEIHALQGNIVSVYKWDLFIPVRIKQSAVEKYKVVEEHKTAAEIISSLSIDNLTSIHFDDDIIAHGDISRSEDGNEFIITNSKAEAMLTTVKQFSVPVKIDARIRLDRSNIFLSFHKGDLIFHDLSGTEHGPNEHNIMFKDIATNHNFWIGHQGMVPVNGYADVCWIIEKDFMSVIVNGNVLHYGVNYPYFDIDCGVDSIRAGAPKDGTLSIQSLEITSLL